MKIKKFKQFNESVPDWMQDQIDDVVGYLSMALKETEKSVQFLCQGVMFIKFDYSDKINYEELVSIQENDRIKDWKILDYVVYEKEFVAVLVASNGSIHYIRKLLQKLLNIKYEDKHSVYGIPACTFHVEDYNSNFYTISLMHDTNSYITKPDYNYIFRIDLEKIYDDKSGCRIKPTMNNVYKIKNEHEGNFKTEIELIAHTIKTCFALDIDPDYIDIK